MAKKKSSKKSKSVKKAPAKKLKLAIAPQGPQIRLPSIRATLDANEVQSIENELRDLMNWVAVFEQEYDLPREVVDQLLNRMHEIAKKVGSLRCHQKPAKFITAP